MFRIAIVISFIVAFSCLVQAQWKDKVSLGQGGEPKIATDGKGNLFATCHLPCKLFVSRDFGASFVENKAFVGAMCDMEVLAWPDGRVNVVYIKDGVSGLASWYSTDSLKTFEQGKGIDGPLDREWLAGNPINNELYMNYSHGYIGGPKSSGVFLAASSDGGKSFVQRGRCDNEQGSSQAVDPYIACSDSGRIYSMWASSSDANTIEKFRFSYSDDGGKTFLGHTTLTELKKDLGDTQERWMLGCLIASGKSNVLAVYPNYSELTIDGKAMKPLLLNYRLSRDGGVTWGAEKTVLSKKEIEECIRCYRAGRVGDGATDFFAQTLPWMCTDPHGRVHIAFQDNRSGQGSINGTNVGKWHVRFASMQKELESFGDSERVSEDVSCNRPPLDFISCCADKSRAYVIWVEAKNAVNGWAFTGELFAARKIIPAPKAQQKSTSQKGSAFLLQMNN